MTRMEHLFPPLWDKAFLQGPVMAIMPHPDDETISCGGVLAYHIGKGHGVKVVLATDGSGGDPEGRFSDLAALRLKELDQALSVLGVKDRLLLGYGDGELAQAGDLQERIVKVLRDSRPATLYMPSPLDCHLDHRALAVATAKAAAQSLDDETDCMVVGVNNLGLPNVLVDVTEFMEVKERALRCFVSQLTYIDFAAKVLWRDKAATVNIEDDSVKACEVFMRLKPSSLEEFLKRAAALEEILYGR